ncbi:serine/threonine-protein kinase STY17-like protein [Tanacetum coccineum]
MTRDRSGAHERLVVAYFSEDPMYDATRFRKTFRMARPLFNRIVNEVANHDAYFYNNVDCTERKGIFELIKCTSAIRQLAYGVNADIYRPEYLRRPTVIDIEKLHRHQEEKHGVTYLCGYYLVDGIYPELATLIKMIPEPSDDDHKRILYKQKQESARKDVERAFGVLKKKYMVLGGSTPSGGHDMKRRTSATSYEVDQISTSASKPSTRFDRTLILFGRCLVGLESKVMRECCFVVGRDGGDEFTLSSLEVLQGFSFFLQMGFTLILATFDGLDVGLLEDVIGEDDCDEEMSLVEYHLCVLHLPKNGNEQMKDTIL